MRFTWKLATDMHHRSLIHIIQVYELYYIHISKWPDFTNLLWIWILKMQEIALSNFEQIKKIKKLGTNQIKKQTTCTYSSKPQKRVKQCIQHLFVKMISKSFNKINKWSVANIPISIKSKYEKTHSLFKVSSWWNPTFLHWL